MRPSTRPVTEPEEERTVEDPIADFFRDGYRGLLGWMAGRSPDGVDVEDAVQEAVVRAWLQPPGEIESLDGWLRSVARNCARSDLRRRDAEARALGRLGPPAITRDGQDDVVGRLEWLDALDHLSNGQRRAVELHYLEDRSVDDVAAEFGVSTGTVKRQLHRARARLAGLLGRTEAGAGLKEARTMTVKDWFMAGSHPHEYEDVAAAEDVYAGKRVVTLRCVADKPTGFGTLMQQCAPDQYVGERIRFSGALRSRDVGGWGGLWFRVDGKTGKSLSFDNMQDRAVKGTTEWARYDVVLDVPEGATLLAYGVLLSGDGELGIADLRIDRVGDDVATTNRRHLDRPANLDFSEVTDDGESTTPR